MRVKYKLKNFLIIIGAIALIMFCISYTNYEVNLTKIKLGYSPEITLTKPLVKAADDKYVSELKSQVENMFSYVDDFNDIDCDSLINDKNIDDDVINKTSKWKLSENFDDKIWKNIENSTDQCSALKKYFIFPEKSFSNEEIMFPLAYGAIVHSQISQVVYMISSLYHPQNVFAIVVDGKAKNDFKKRITLLSDCFNNIHIIHTNKIGWCSYEIVRGIFTAVKYLSQLNHPWKYFQYLSGVDLPLKTNLEMVRIFKQLNGAYMCELSDFQKHRLKNFKVSNITLYKASLSATFSRKSADYMINSQYIRTFINLLKNTLCPDESIWGTIAGNINLIPIPGGFDGAKLLQAKKTEQQRKKNNEIITFYDKPPEEGETFRPTQYYLPRYQIWTKKKCKGNMVSGSCVFGIRDLPVLVKRAELVVHKLYFKYQPATYFCLLKNHWKRALDLKQQKIFNAKSYSKLAQVELINGKSYEELKFYSNDHW